MQISDPAIYPENKVQVSENILLLPLRLIGIFKQPYDHPHSRSFQHFEHRIRIRNTHTVQTGIYLWHLCRRIARGSIVRLRPGDQFGNSPFL